MKLIRTGAAAAALLALGLSIPPGCGGSSGSSGGTTTPPPGATPSIALRAPTDGATVSVRAVTAVVDVENFILDSDIGGADVAGHGHWHFLIDGQTAGMFAVTTVPPTDLSTAIQPGVHQVRVELHSNQHEVVTPQIETPTTPVTVTFQ